MSDATFKKALQSSYDQNAALREKSEVQSWKRHELDHFLSLVDRQGGMIPDILDVGAGAGQHAQYMQEAGVEVTCIDLSPAMVEVCARKGLHAIAMDFYNLRFADQIFDGIWAMNSLLHVPKADLLPVLREIRRVLKPGGIFYMGVYGGYNSEGIWEEDSCVPQRFFSFYDEERIKEKVGQIFEIESFRTVPLEEMRLDYQSMFLRKARGRA